MIQTKKPYRWLTFEGDKGHKRVIETRQFKDELIIGIGFNSISIKGLQVKDGAISIESVELVNDWWD